MVAKVKGHAKWLHVHPLTCATSTGKQDDLDYIEEVRSIDEKIKEGEKKILSLMDNVLVRDLKLQQPQ